MALKLIECTHCGFKFKTDIEKQLESGEITTTRSIRQVKEIDITCPKCNKIFEYLW